MLLPEFAADVTYSAYTEISAQPANSNLWIRCQCKTLVRIVEQLSYYMLGFVSA